MKVRSQILFWLSRGFLPLAVAGLLVARAADAQDKPSAERTMAAVKLGLPLIEQAAGRYPTHRKCFSCHHQTLPALAMNAGCADLEAAEKFAKAQAEFTAKSFGYQLQDLREGKNIGGKAMTVSYGLWTLELAAWPADETTEAMVAYLIKTQLPDGHWELHANRPPMEESALTCLAIAIQGLRAYAAESQAQARDEAIAKAKSWLANQTSGSQEDRTSRLWALVLLQSPPEELQAARAAVIAAQRADGGWAQIDSMESDAYATGQTLFRLKQAGLSTSDPIYRRGVEFLLKAQREDGSWFVQTRSKPVQVYFDNGDPHAKDQFISTPATCWALAALGMGKKD